MDFSGQINVPDLNSEDNVKYNFSLTSLSDSLNSTIQPNVDDICSKDCQRSEDLTSSGMEPYISKCLDSQIGKAESKLCVLLNRTTEEKRNKHEAAVQETELDEQEINRLFDSQIRVACNELKNHLEDLKKRVDTRIQRLDSKHLKICDLNKGLLTDSLDIIYKANWYRLNYLDEFHNKMIDLEKTRTASYREKYKKLFKNLMEIGYFLPYDVQEYFDDKILRFNQITLNNLHHYEELVHQLRLQVENDTKDWIQKLKMLNVKWKNILSNTIEKELKIAISKASLSSAPNDEDFAGVQKEMKEAGKNLNQNFNVCAVPIKAKDLEAFFAKIQKCMVKLEQGAKRLITIYRQVIVTIYTRFFDELQRLADLLTETGLFSDLDVYVMENDLFVVSLNGLAAKFENDIEGCKQLCQEEITTLNESVEKMFTFVATASHLWSRHFYRIQALEALIYKELDKILKKASDIHEEEEMRLNIFLDGMRQESNIAELDKQLEQVKGILKNIEIVMSTLLTAEKNVISKFGKYMNVEVEVLLKEINRFLITHPPDWEVDPKKQRKRASQTSHKSLDYRDKLPIEMLYLHYRVESINNWVFGLWEAIQMYTEKCRSEIEDYAKDWMAKTQNLFKKRFNAKMHFLSSRFDRIKTMIYEKRLKELNFHQDVLSRHETAVTMQVEVIIKLSEDFPKQHVTRLNNFKAEGSVLIGKMIEVQNILKAELFKCKLDKNTRELQSYMNKVLAQYNRISSNCKQRIIISEYQYLRSIRMFDNYGNFDNKEALATLKSLEKLTFRSEALIEKTNKSFKSIYGRALRETNNSIDYYQNIAKQCLEEYRFIETIDYKLKQLQGKAGEEVFALKFSLNSDQDIINKFKYETKLVMKKSLEPDGVLEKYSDIYDRLKLHKNYLLHPEPDSPSKIQFKKPGRSSQSILDERGTKHKVKLNLKKKDTASVLMFKDYSHELNKIKYSQIDNSFHGNINKRFMDSFKEVQSMTMKFYFGHNKFYLDESIIKPNYDSFIEQILNRYVCYQAQGKLKWMEFVNEFIEITCNFLNFMNDYVTEISQEFYKKQCSNFASFVETQLDTLEEAKEDLKNSFIDLHNKLKPLHGHPANKDLLDKLCMKMQKIVHKNKGKLVDLAGECKTKLVIEYSASNAAIKRLEDKLSLVARNNSTDNLISQLYKQLEVKAIFTDLEQFSNILTPENDLKLDVKISSPDFSSTVFKFLKTFQPKPSQVDVALQKSNQLEECFETNMYNIGKYETLEKEIIESYEEMWQNDVDHILALYKVKYDVSESSGKD